MLRTVARQTDHLVQPSSPPQNWWITRGGGSYIYIYVLYMYTTCVYIDIHMRRRIWTTYHIDVFRAHAIFAKPCPPCASERIEIDNIICINICRTSETCILFHIRILQGRGNTVRPPLGFKRSRCTNQKHRKQIHANTAEFEVPICVCMFCRYLCGTRTGCPIPW